MIFNDNNILRCKRLKRRKRQQLNLIDFNHIKSCLPQKIQEWHLNKYNANNSILDLGLLIDFLIF